MNDEEKQLLNSIQNSIDDVCAILSAHEFILEVITATTVAKMPASLAEKFLEDFLKKWEEPILSGCLRSDLHQTEAKIFACAKARFEGFIQKTAEREMLIRRAIGNY